MRVIDFGEASCRRIRDYLDSYLSGELLVETNLEVQRHLQSCPACCQEFREAAEIRRSLRDAARREQTPAGLQARIHAGIRRDRKSRRRLLVGMSIAASVLVAISVGWIATIRISGHAPHELMAQEMYISSLPEFVGAVTFLGFADHLHCGVYWKILQHDIHDAEILDELGTELAPLAGIFREELPDDYEIRLAHRCKYRGRTYIHFVARREDDKLVSLVLTERVDGESFRVTDGLLPVSEVLGAEIFGSSIVGYHLAGFEAGRYVGFVVSDLSGDGNLALAQAIVPEVRAFMSGVEG
ncbi:MAG: zf-HC2 domain-containing protein [Acidobacteria bacterium]|nr:zf-HC2 domain-containing protein [Acidobacteriota bacterium]